MALAPRIHWFRQDLRLEHHLAWDLEPSRPTLGVYIWAPQEDHPWEPGAASQWWLHHALADLKAQLQAKGSDLILLDARNSSSLQELEKITQKSQASHLTWSRRYEPQAIARDSQIKTFFSQKGIKVVSYNDTLLHEPREILNQSSKPFRVFTPFWKHLTKLLPPASLSSTQPNWDLSASKYHQATLETLQLLPSIAWDGGFYKTWKPTRQGALEKLTTLGNSIAAHYQKNRDFPYLDGTSQLSAYLHFGQISAREIMALVPSSQPLQTDWQQGIIRQLYWREFAHYLLYHFPQSHHKALYSKYESFPWQYHQEFIDAFEQGKTGYPIIDAGMAQLWQTGWMHNRVRMIVGSFLVKHSLQDWMVGARWFWDTLVDANLANNTLGWQWVAGCGADAAPYVRVCTPILQSPEFYPEAEYIRTYLPELKNLDSCYLPAPWQRRWCSKIFHRALRTIWSGPRKLRAAW